MGVRRRTGLSEWQLRVYSDSGLIGEVNRTEGGHRLYSREQVELLERVATWRRAGLQVREIRDLLRKDANALGQHLARRRNELERLLHVVDALERAARRGYDSLPTVRAPRERGRSVE